jgi:hypothetical protein
MIVLSTVTVIAFSKAKMIALQDPRSHSFLDHPSPVTHSVSKYTELYAIMSDAIYENFIEV